MQVIETVYNPQGDFDQAISMAQPLFIQLMKQIIQRGLSEGRLVVKDGVVVEWTKTSVMSYNHPHYNLKQEVFVS